MEFEFDPVKSILNKAKHGMDFKQAQELWDDPGIEFLPGKWKSEDRWLAIGKIDDKFWSVVFTVRDGAIRLISARRSRRKEIQFYEGQERHLG